MRYSLAPMLVLALLLCMGANLLLAQADQPGPLRVGIATADITPEQPAWMWGFGGRNRPSEGTARPLLAQVVVFDNGQTRLAIVSLDVCFTGYRHLCRMRTAAEAVGIPEQHLMVNVSHSHYGPRLGGAEVDIRNAEYNALFMERTMPLFAAAVANLQPALLDYTVGRSSMGINRRQLDDEGMATRGMRPEPRKPMDPDVPVLRVLTPDGQIRAVIFGYACHPTTTSGRMLYLHGTDFPGYARDWIEAAYPEATAVFLQGFGGDIKPGAVQPSVARQPGRLNVTVLVDEMGTKAAMGHELGRGAIRALATPPPPVPADRSTELDEALATPIVLGGVVELVDMPSKADPERFYVSPTHMGMWRIGDVYIFGSQHEVLSAIGLRIKQELPDTRIWTNGYTHWGSGYFADTASFKEGGYEVDRTAFVPEAEDILVANVHRYMAHLQANAVNTEPIPRCSP